MSQNVSYQKQIKVVDLLFPVVVEQEYGSHNA